VTPMSSRHAPGPSRVARTPAPAPPPAVAAPRPAPPRYATAPDELPEAAPLPLTSPAWSSGPIY
jgi:hypothetical protein